MECPTAFNPDDQIPPEWEDVGYGHFVDLLHDTQPDPTSQRAYRDLMLAYHYEISSGIDLEVFPLNSLRKSIWMT
jgi:hypothetical protein